MTRKTGRPDRWTGLGCPVSEADYLPRSEDLDRLRDARQAVTLAGWKALLAMASRTGHSDAVRRLAWEARRDARLSGVIVPPWWALRLAIRAFGWPKDFGTPPHPPGELDDGA